MQRIIFLFFLVLIVNNSGFALPPPEEILKKVDEIRAPSKHFSCDLEIVSKQGEKKRTKKFKLFVGDETKSLVKFVYPPADKGKFLLMVDENLWFYTQGIRKPIRITPQQRLLGEVSNGDVARVVYSIDYSAVSISEMEIDNKKVYELQLVAKRKNATYGKITLLVEKETFNPYKAEFYAVSGKRLKTAYYKNYELILEKKRPTKMEIIDEHRKNRSSIMKYSNFEIKKFPEYYFQKTHLKYLR